MRAIGDLATFMLSGQFQARLRISAETAAQEATTGITQEKTRHLGGSTLAISLLDRKAQLLEQHQRGIAEAAVFASATQQLLDRIQNQASQLASDLALASQIQTSSELKTLSVSAERVFVDTVNALNTEIAGRFLLSGSATDAKPLLDGQTLLDMLRNDIVGPMTPDAAKNAIAGWFETLGGPFETNVYSGSVSGFAQHSIGPENTVTFGLRADSDSVRELLAGLATAVFASEPALGFAVSDQQDLLEQARKTLVQTDRTLTEERAGVGLIEMMIEASRVETENELERTDLNRMSLLGVDQFQAASEFEAAQQQLDVFYRIAARQGRVSLAEYLR